LINRLEQLNAELADIIGGRDELGLAFPLMIDCWCGATRRELTRLEFDPREVEQLLDERLKGAALEVLTVPRRTKPDA
jgi:hypothetical protein